jgi:hypothetical protein
MKRSALLGSFVFAIAAASSFGYFVATGRFDCFCLIFVFAIASLVIADDSKLSCSLFGHRYDPDGERHGYYDCERCEAVGYEPLPTFASLVQCWILWHLYDLVYRWRRRLYCRECRAWFGRHTDLCLPF